MEAQADYKELLVLLNATEVEYVIVGAYALAFHGYPRYTGDIGILVRPSPENAERTMTALREFGFSGLGLSATDFTRQDNVVQLGRAPIRVDLMTSLSGVTWHQVFNNSITGEYGDVPVRYIGRTELVKNKRSTGRMKDRADLEALGEI